MKRFTVLFAVLMVIAVLSGCCLQNPAVHTDTFVTGLELNAKTANTLAIHLVPVLEGRPLPLSEAAKKKDDPETWEKRHLIALLKQHRSHSNTLAKKGGGFKEKDKDD